MLHSNERSTRGTTIFSVVLAAGDDSYNRPAAMRLRALLKIALRGLNLKCIEVREVGADEPELLRELLDDVIAKIDDRGCK